MGKLAFNSQRLIEARKACKLTQSQVADALGLERSSYTNYELGKTTPSYKALTVLARLFHTEPTWFLLDEASGFCSMESIYDIRCELKEHDITELSKDERSVIVLYRAIRAKGRSEEIIDLLKSMCKE